MLQNIYRYDYASQLHPVQQGSKLSLASDQNVVSDPAFLKARVLFPDVTAKSLRAVSEIVGSRFYMPPSMLARILREADPVATIGTDAVRFEGFSACCSAYIRLDMNNGALATQERHKGTTNVDFGPELRGALAAVSPDTEMEITIGSKSVEIVADGAAFIEKKVPLPTRWIKGFAEVQVAVAGMEPVFSLPRVAAQRFLRGLPRGKNDQQIWITSNGGAALVRARENKGAVPLRGSHRLKVFEPLVGQADRLDVHYNRASGATSWALNFGEQQLWLVLNAEPWRGFSGDGGLLSRMSAPENSGLAAIAAQLHWQDRIDVDVLAGSTGLARERIGVALAQLAASGRLGFDLKQNAYFHRELPFDMSQIERLNPRLKSARALLERGAVSWVDGVAEVSSQDVVHRVMPDEQGWRCTCPWYAKNGSQRGPCKHMLAAEMELDRAK